MGLGKTLQSIAFMAAILGKTGNDVGDKNFPELHPLQSIVPPDADGRPGADVAACPRFSPDYSGTGAPILVVATASLLDNWMREMGKWGTFRAIKLHGSSMDRGLAAVRSGGEEVAITTYTAVRIHIEKFETIPWHVVFFDEAHTLKNDKTATYTAANRLPTRLRFGLTGTVFQNRHSEMFCLLDLLCYGCLGEKGEFEVNVEKPIKVGMRSDASNAEMAESKAAIARLRSALKPILLRRKKDIIQHQLPKKTEHVVFCELAPMQLAAYRRVLALQDVELVLNAKQPCPCGSKKPRFSCQECEGGYWKVNEEQGGVLYPHYHYCDCSDVHDKHANPNGCKRHNPDGCWRHSKFGHQRICPFCLCLPIISLLRNVALHLDLVKADPADNNDVKRREFEWKIELAEAVLGQDLNALGGPVQDARLVTLTETTSCGKLAVLKSLLQKWAHDQAGSRGRVHKVLIFSSVVRMLKVVRAVAEAEGYEHMYLDGATPQGERQPLVDAFNHPDSSAFLFLASTLAGGVGLNLTAANKVIILDPNWNPAADLQAQDRAFRIGQDRDVDVYRFVAAGTLEETMWLRQLSKQQHAAIAVEGSDAERRLFAGMERSKNGKYDGVDGEIFGMVNLLRHDVDRVRALEVLDGRKDESGDVRGKTAGCGGGGEAEMHASQLENNNDDRRHNTTNNRQHKIEYRIETLDAEKVAQLASERRGKQAVPNKGTDGSAFGKDGEHASDIDDEGLLLRACGAAAVVPSSKLRLAAKPRAGAKEVDRLAGLDADRAAAAIAAKLDPNRPAYRTARQRKVAGEVAQAVSEIQPASGVSCLARWLGISIKDAAKALLDLDPENRARLRERYAEEAPMGLMP
jgi:DNA excision repair protein ERCC-6-like 2